MSTKRTKPEDNSSSSVQNPEHSEIEIQDFQFPLSQRENGASVELVHFESGKEVSFNSWVKENIFRSAEPKNRDGENPEASVNWGIISQAKSKKEEESMFLTLSLRKVLRTRLDLRSGQLRRVEEEVVEPEISEFHVKHRDGFLELYSFNPKQKNVILNSLAEAFGEESISQMYVTKDAMKSLMTEAIEVTSVSLSGLGNPFFSDASFSGTDPANSKTYKELLNSGGEIRSFRGKFQTVSAREDAGSPPLVATINSSKCKIHFSRTQTPIAQSDVEDFVQRVANIASAVESTRTIESDGRRRKERLAP